MIIFFSFLFLCFSNLFSISPAQNLSEEKHFEEFFQALHQSSNLMQIFETNKKTLLDNAHSTDDSDQTKFLNLFPREELLSIDISILEAKIQRGDAVDKMSLEQSERLSKKKNIPFSLPQINDLSQPQNYMKEFEQKVRDILINDPDFDDLTDDLPLETSLAIHCKDANGNEKIISIHSHSNKEEFLYFWAYLITLKETGIDHNLKFTILPPISLSDFTIALTSPDDTTPILSPRDLPSDSDDFEESLPEGSEEEILSSQILSLFKTEIINVISDNQAKMFLSFVNEPSKDAIKYSSIAKNDHKAWLRYYLSNLSQKKLTQMPPLFVLLTMFLMENSHNYYNVSISENSLFEKFANNFFQTIPQASLNKIRDNYLKNLPTLQDQLLSIDLVQKERFLKNLKNLLLESPSKRIIVRMIVKWFRKIFFRSFYKKQANNFFSLFEKIKTNSSESSQFLKDSLNKTLEIFENFQNSPFGKALKLDTIPPFKKITLFGKREGVSHISTKYLNSGFDMYYSEDWICHHISSKMILDNHLFINIPQEYKKRFHLNSSSLAVFILKNLFEKIFKEKFKTNPTDFKVKLSILLTLRRALKLNDRFNFENNWKIFIKNSKKIFSDKETNLGLLDLMKNDQYELFWDTISLEEDNLAEQIENISQIQKQLELKKNA